MLDVLTHETPTLGRGFDAISEKHGKRLAFHRIPKALNARKECAALWIILGR